MSKSHTSIQKIKEQINRYWQENTPENAKDAVLALDIGGTKISAALYSRDGCTIASEPLEDLGSAATPRGLEDLAKGYKRLFKDAVNKARDRGYGVVAVGIGSPGRFVDKALADQRYGASQASEMQKFALGQPYEPGMVIAPGTAKNLEQVDGEMDQVNLQAVLSRFTPDGVALRVLNDAAAQLGGLVAGMAADADLSGLVRGKKLVYFGPGTGLGGAVMNEKGDLVTDGHYQYIKLAKRDDDTAGIFDIVLKANAKKYEPLESPPQHVYPEDMLSGTGIGMIISKVSNGAIANTKDFEARYQQNPKDPELTNVTEALRVVGRYMADVLIALKRGEFEHMDPKAQWPQQDKAAVKDFGAVILGGGLTEAKFYKDIVLQSARYEMDGRGYGADSVDIIQPDGVKNAALLGALQALNGVDIKPVADVAKAISAPKKLSA